MPKQATLPESTAQATVEAERATSKQSTTLPEYIERNRAAWDRWAPAVAGAGARAWRRTELEWGLWESPEYHLQLLARVDKPRADIVELGCGTAAISAWLRRLGARPVAVDFSQKQLATAERLQAESDVHFPLIYANAEEVPFEDASFDLALSEYGASLWCDPGRWLKEARRLLRTDGLLVFFTSSPLLMTCLPSDGTPAGETLVRDHFSRFAVEFSGEDAVEFHLTHGDWIRALQANGFAVAELVEVRPPPGAKPRYNFVSTDWARRWPSEDIWVARRVE
jgi:ubiquinone/menaquinone biosynthesis C-methylase UbiE